LIDTSSLKEIEVNFAFSVVGWVITVAVNTFWGRSLSFLTLRGKVSFAAFHTPWRMVAVGLRVPEALAAMTLHHSRSLFGFLHLYFGMEEVLGVKYFFVLWTWLQVYKE
jgi:hypothetical protein